MTALTRAAPRRGDGMITVHNSNSEQKNAPPKRGKFGLNDDEQGKRERALAQ